MPTSRLITATASCITAGAMLLAGCATPPVPPPPAESAHQWTERWQAFALPGKRATAYAAGRRDGRWVLHARSERSASMHRRSLRIEPDQLGTVRFSWQVAALVEGADVRESDSEDAPVRVLLAFDGDHARLNPRTRMMFDLMHSLSGETPPYATLMYVWDNQGPVESVVINRRSDRVRKIVVESGAAHLGQWRSYQRDVVADYRRAFGEAPGALISIAVMTDTDNTQSRAEAWYGEVSLQPRAQP